VQAVCSADQQDSGGDSFEQSASASSDRAAPIVIPFTIQNGAVVVHGKVGKARERFIVDTGAAMTIVQHFVAQAAGLSSDGSEAKTFTGINSKMKMRQAIVPEMRLGDFIRKDVPVHISTPYVLTGGPGCLLGMDFMRHYAVTFDFEHNQLQLSEQLGAVPENSVMVPIKGAPSPSVSGVINGAATETFVVDTGCHWPLFLTAESAERSALTSDNGSPVPEADAKKKTFVVDAHHTVRQAPRLVIKTLDVGTIRLVDVDAAIVNSVSGSKGVNLLGLPFLMRFASAIFDFPGHRLILVRKQKPQQPPS